MNDTELFIHALESNELDNLIKIPKADLHNHGALGGNLKNISSKYNIRIPYFTKGNSIADMKEYIKNNLGIFMKNKETYTSLIEESIIQAFTNDGITDLELSVDLRYGEFFEYDYFKVINTLKNLKEKYAAYIKVNFDIGISRGNFDFDIMYDYFQDLLSTKFFTSVDVYGDEFLPLKKSIIKLYKNLPDNIIKKFHLGEFGTVENTIQTLKILDVDVIQHGINIVKDSRLQKIIKSKNIFLNICPQSNISLGIVKDIRTHPIRQIFDMGIKFTLCTDDFLIFNKSISQTYIDLYSHEIFSAKELNIIRKNGLEAISSIFSLKKTL